MRADQQEAGYRSETPTDEDVTSGLLALGPATTIAGRASSLEGCIPSTVPGVAPIDGPASPFAGPGMVSPSNVATAPTPQRRSRTEGASAIFLPTHMPPPPGDMDGRAQPLGSHTPHSVMGRVSVVDPTPNFAAPDVVPHMPTCSTRFDMRQASQPDTMTSSAVPFSCHKPAGASRLPLQKQECPSARIAARGTMSLDGCIPSSVTGTTLLSGLASCFAAHGPSTAGPLC